MNAAIYDGTAIYELMRCFKQKRIDNEHFPRLTKRVTELRSTEGGMTAVCEVMKKYEDIAKAQGIAQGIATEKASLAKKLIASGSFTDEQIAELTGSTLEKIAVIRNGSAA